MATTYTLINSNTLASSAASVTFSSIPATYTDLVLRISARSDRAATFDWIFMTINGITTNTYSNTSLDGSGTSAASNQLSNRTYATIQYVVDGDTATANTFGSTEIYIPSYTASQNKPFSAFGAQENNTTAAYMIANAGLWRNTAAITELKLETNAQLWVSGSSFYLYGISNA
jgi:hypothetical protein